MPGCVTAALRYRLCDSMSPLRQIMKTPPIRIITGNHLCHNPRVIKEASTLAEHGYDVEVLGAWTMPELARRDSELVQVLPFRFCPVVDATRKGLASRVLYLSMRAVAKSVRVLYQRTGIGLHHQLSPWVAVLSRKLKTKPDAFCIAHSEGAMAVASTFAMRGGKTGVDFEDWFSEDLLPEARRDRPVGMLRGLERTLLLCSAYTSCPSRAMSRALSEEFGCQPPHVLYNAFAWADRQALKGESLDRRDQRVRSVHWYSQTIGPGRGLENLFMALPHVAAPVEVHLRGTPVERFEEWLKGQVPEGWHDKVFVHPVVANDQLLSRIAEHDIGFAGEVPFCRSRDLTVTNKILHYLLAGLAVVASDTRGQTEIAEMAGTVSRGEPVLLYPAGDPLALAARIDYLLAGPDRLAEAKAAALTAAKQTFCWERQAPILLDSVRAALSGL